MNQEIYRLNKEKNEKQREWFDNLGNDLPGNLLSGKEVIRARDEVIRAFDGVTNWRIFDVILFFD